MRAVVLCLFTVQAGGWAGEFRADSVGLRMGASLTSSHRIFYQAEAFSNWMLPWDKDLGRHWKMSSRFDLSAGGLVNRGETGFIGNLGPSLVFAKAESPLAFVAGGCATFLSRAVYADKNFGLYFQFTSHVGVEWHLGSHVELGYRFQHMSNAGLGKPNPGLNMHMFMLGYRF